MLILGIETSCDETSVALVRDGREVLENLIATQVKLHAPHGGVVPELASRAHLRMLAPMIEQALAGAQCRLEDVDAIAVTQGPGLIGALLVGVETAKALAYAVGKPLIPVNHIAAHLYAPFLRGEGPRMKNIIVEGGVQIPGESPEAGAGAAPGADEFPLHYPHVGLVVSGGHTSLVVVHNACHFELLGETLDDAAGEAFDKVAKLLELGYPGGPIIDRQAKEGDRTRFTLPRPMLRSGDFDFSFSGLKTAVSEVVLREGRDAFRRDPQLVRDLCASFQEAVVEVLLRKARAALEARGIRELAIVGGVACNSRLREAAGEYLPDMRIVFPSPILCTDNAAMIAGLAWHWRDRVASSWLGLEARADLSLV
ncbi:MAG: tRNA (adenosine(37)-N6)-threonylcarbamoyltransferase complex transferase subunit TsaD [Candidatus Sumerlaeaceae bacterium]|nr:tRNA (adenosine(37)-N6)-threonylcarbamoyltransferase complex transferase subunit TsaD [Candidatus Sumerlaeaceae bacterium]